MLVQYMYGCMCTRYANDRAGIFLYNVARSDYVFAILRFCTCTYVHVHAGLLQCMNVYMLLHVHVHVHINVCTLYIIQCTCIYM